jgi:hypothetical protein
LSIWIACESLNFKYTANLSKFSRVISSLSALRLYLSLGDENDWTIISFISFAGRTFPHRLWWRIIPYNQFRLKVHSGCALLAEDAYSS